MSKVLTESPVQGSHRSSVPDGEPLCARCFRMEDADFCFKVRSRAYILEFYDELGPEAVAACVNAYMPADYVGMAQGQELFVVESDHVPVGFFTIARHDRISAEIPLIFVELELLGRGIGSWCMRYIEEWVRENWAEVTRLFLDTIIPKYNGGFYRKMGFEQIGESVCRFPGIRIPAVRFAKQVR